MSTSPIAVHPEMNPANVDPNAAWYRRPTSTLHDVFYQAFTSTNLEQHRQARDGLRDFQMAIAQSTRFLSLLSDKAELAHSGGVEILQRDINQVMDLVTGLGAACSEVDSLMEAADLHSAEKVREWRVLEAVQGRKV